ncbi:phenylalanyl-tRNA synthetase subunit beta [Croceibacterium mercuriale]|uniref:Phenylalanine--tRNA ligase beta subunit n=1 Tax=Croceibacterium mercuriale TaxID=1572751 RepID=A0A0B2BSK3_9SPHN|nr:phenylalanine--tRNA ligase subunit beta [Croceibacterium mercuriale]KHL24553.1 phenylalanyl-tRNA synthetase subunit beta [Croceibacterium mercuriale]
MKFSAEWLARHLDTDATTAEIAAKLNELGIEVEGVDDPARALEGFRVAEVLTAAPHPQADRLQVLSVDTGEGAPLQVVCGAANARAGMKGVLGLPGATVPANGMVLRKSAIRGVESNGMMCSVRELQLGDEHEGIIELPADAPVGMPVAEYFRSSPVFDVSITPNRPDCMGVHGIARDLAAAGLGTLKDAPIPAIAGSFPCPVTIRTNDPAGCPAFFGRVIRGVKNGPSPSWLQQALISAGQRPISALVDVTNYLSLGFGRPAHVYDLAKLTGPVVARRATDGEEVLALNGKTYRLDPSMLVIADDAGVHDIAGIMGGEESSVTDGTTDVLLEIAYFDPESIGATGRKLGLASDARTRFERGVDPAFLEDGLELLTGMIIEFCGGEASEVVRAGTPPLDTAVIGFDPQLTQRLGGVAVPDGEQRTILERLGFAVAADWTVTAPTWRPDIIGPADLVEEVVRVHGIDRIESVALPRADGVARPTATPAQLTERRVRRAAAARGLMEAVTWSFLPASAAEPFVTEGETPWVLDNPISEDLKVMRPSLLPGLLLAAGRNMARGAAALRLFEIGRRYGRSADGSSAERLTLGVVLAGERTPRGWASGKAAGFDAFNAKAEALALLAEAGAPVDKLQVMGEAGAQFHPGQSGTLRLGPKVVLARFGALHPATLKAFDLTGAVMAVELFLDAIPPRKSAGFAKPAYSPPPLQPVLRDYAFLVPVTLPAGDLLRAVKGADKGNIVDVRLFDDFRGAGVPEGQKSLAVEVLLQPQGESYTEAVLTGISDKVVAAAAKLGATLRG